MSGFEPDYTKLQCVGIQLKGSTMISPSVQAPLPFGFVTGASSDEDVMYVFWHQATIATEVGPSIWAL